MSVPRDRLLPEGVPADLRERLTELARAPLMVTVRRRGCGCLLGTVRRLSGVGDVFAGEPRILVREQIEKKRARRRQTVIVLDRPDTPILELACSHGTTSPQDESLLELLRARVASVARGDTPSSTSFLL